MASPTPQNIYIPTYVYRFMISVNSGNDICMSICMNTEISETIRGWAIQFDNNMHTLVWRTCLIYNSVMLFAFKAHFYNKTIIIYYHPKFTSLKNSLRLHNRHRSFWRNNITGGIREKTIELTVACLHLQLKTISGNY